MLLLCRAHIDLVCSHVYLDTLISLIRPLITEYIKEGSKNSRVAAVETVVQLLYEIQILQKFYIAG